jgi:hypothetical protein
MADKVLQEDSKPKEYNKENIIRSEKLTVDKIELFHEAIDEKQELEFEVEYKGKKEKVYVTLNMHFSKKKIAECVAEYVAQLDKLFKKQKDVPIDFLEMYLIFQILNHFTDIDMPKNLDSQISVLEKLIDTGLLFHIFVEFPQEEITNLIMEVDRINEKLNQNLDEFEEELKQFDYEKLQSNYVKEILKE